MPIVLAHPSGAGGRHGLAAFLRRSAAWAISVAIALAFPCALIDTILLVMHGAPLRVGIAAGLAGAGLGVWIALLVGPMLAIIAALSERLSRAPAPLHWLWPAPIAIAQLIVAWGMIGLTRHTSPRFAVLLLCGLAVVLVVSTLLNWAKHVKLAFATVGVLVGVLLAFDFWLPGPLYRELHDVAGFGVICATLAMLGRVRRWISASGRRHVAFAILGALAFSILAVQSVDRIAPGWRSAAWLHGRHALRIARACHALVDLDGDGYSPLAWGGDCDDSDAKRNPLARDRPDGIDHNCNGVAPPEHPSSAQRGLTKPFGAPDLEPGQVDLVLLLTIDTMRADAFQPNVVPHLWALAKTGLRFTRVYAGGSRTRLSLPLLQRPSDMQPRVVETLAAQGISSTAIFSLADTELSPALHGFGHVERPADGLWNAEEITKRAIADLRAHPTGRHYLWVHYIDAHDPYRMHQGGGHALHARGGTGDHDAYLRELTIVDADVQQILDELTAQGRTGRTAILVSADHGEGFGEHGIWFHGTTGFEPIIRVPAVLVAPEIAPGEYGELASHRDVPATLLGAFGLAQSSGAEAFGRSWFRLRAGYQPLHRFTVTRSARYVAGEDAQTAMAIIVEGTQKFCKSFENGMSELYDLVRDPNEDDDRIGRDDVGTLERDLELFRDLDQYP